MKTLVIDRDELSTQLIKSKLEPLGHQVTEETVKNNAVDHLAANQYDIICIDPSPLTSARPVILNIRRSVTNYPYIILMSHEISVEDAVKAGCNDLLTKPLDGEALSEKVEKAKQLIALESRISDDSEDFPSAGGVIAKSAFNQLFLSALDRAGRYGERTYVIFISLSNYQDVLDMDGPYAADYAVAKLSQYLVHLRRQSDIIAQTAKYEYALLLQRPNYETEPVEAADRYAESIGGYDDIVSSGASNIEITVTLVDLPACTQLAKHVISREDNAS